MNEPSDLDKLKAALERERIAVETARADALHWKRVAYQLDEQIQAMKAKKR